MVMVNDTEQNPFEGMRKLLELFSVTSVLAAL